MGSETSFLLNHFIFGVSVYVTVRDEGTHPFTQPPFHAVGEDISGGKGQHVMAVSFSSLPFSPLPTSHHQPLFPRNELGDKGK